MSSFNKAQISFEFYAALSVALLLFLSSIIFTSQMRKNEEDRQILLSSFMLAQQIANAADVMQRNLCADDACQLSLLLPNRIKGASFPKEVEYNITFQSNWVVVTPVGYPSVRVAAGIPLESFRISLEQRREGKILRMEGGG